MLAMLSPSYLIPLFTQTFTILILYMTMSERIDLEGLLKVQLSKCKHGNIGTFMIYLIHIMTHTDAECIKGTSNRS